MIKISKTIKLDENTYNNLDDVREKHETFTQVVSRLIDLYRTLRGMEPILRGSTAYHEFRKTQEPTTATPK